MVFGRVGFEENQLVGGWAGIGGTFDSFECGGWRAIALSLVLKDVAGDREFSDAGRFGIDDQLLGDAVFG